MPSVLGAASAATRWPRSIASTLWRLAAAAALCAGPAQAAERPPAAVLLDRLCAHTLRANEEDRLYGVISLTVRTTIKYEGGVFSPDLIDDAVQDGLGAMIDACPKIAATADDERLGMVVELIRDATLKRMQDRAGDYNNGQTVRATAADLSEELSSREIDAWLDALSPRQRALALFLYGSRADRVQMADAVGLSPAGLPAAFGEVKSELLKFFRADWNAAPPPPIPAEPAIEFSVADQELEALLELPATAAGAADGAKAGPDDTAETARITGISREIYSGWSLLASVTGLPADRNLKIGKATLLVPDEPGHRRMIAVALDEISDPHDAVRRFLVKAYAIDADKDGSGLNDGFRLAVSAPPLSPDVGQILHNRTLADIEIARCLWYEFGTAPDPGLCRPAP